MGVDCSRSGLRVLTDVNRVEVEGPVAYAPAAQRSSTGHIRKNYHISTCLRETTGETPPDRYSPQIRSDQPLSSQCPAPRRGSESDIGLALRTVLATSLRQRALCHLVVNFRMKSLALNCQTPDDHHVSITSRNGTDTFPWGRTGTGTFSRLAVLLGRTGSGKARFS